MKTVFLISGFKLDVTAAGRDYKDLRAAISAKGYRVVPVDIKWRQTTVTQFAEKFIKLYEQQRSGYNIVIGNSFGAVVAFITAPRIRPDRLYLCSLSPFFKEDIKSDFIKDYATKKFGKRRLTDVGKYSANEIADNISNLHIATTLLFGQKERGELGFLVRRVQNTAKRINGAKLVEIPGAPHSLRDPVYSDGLTKLLL